MEHKGWFALDIDGTLTHGAYSIPENVISYLKKRFSEGWKIIILTGRSFPFAWLSVSKLDFPYVLSTQNGSTAWHMPQKEPIFESFFEKEIFKKIGEEVKNSEIALIIYGEDYKCYFKKNERYSQYVDSLVTLSLQEKVLFEDFEIGPIPLRAPLIKIVGNKEYLQTLKACLEKKDLGEAPIIEDPFHKDYHLMLLTKKGVSKGSCIKKIISKAGGGKVIAAGNDNNDLSMFDVADIKIAMEDSCASLLKNADIIAPSCDKFGIIEGLDMAIERL